MKTVYYYIVKYDKKEYHLKAWARTKEDGAEIIERVWNNVDFIDVFPEKRKKITPDQIKYVDRLDNMTASHVISVEVVNIDQGKYSNTFNGIEAAIKALEEGGGLYE
jgi:hypothetical protein